MPPVDIGNSPPGGGSPTFDDGTFTGSVGVNQNLSVGGNLLAVGPATFADDVDVAGDLAVLGGAAVQVAFISDEIDFAAPAATHAFGGNWPALPGYQLVISSIRIFMTNIAATTFSTNGSLQIGNNVAVDNISLAAVAQPNASALNTGLAASPGGAYNHGAISANGIVRLPDLTTPPSVKINTAVTGTAITQCKGRIIAFGVLSQLFPVV